MTPPLRSRRAVLRVLAGILVAGGAGTALPPLTGAGAAELEHRRVLDRIYEEDAERYLYQNIAFHASLSADSKGAEGTPYVDEPAGVGGEPARHLRRFADELAAAAYGENARGEQLCERPDAETRAANLREWYLSTDVWEVEEQIAGEGRERGLLDGRTSEGGCESCGHLREEVIDRLVVLTGPPSPERSALTTIERPVIEPPGPRTQRSAPSTQGSASRSQVWG